MLLSRTRTRAKLALNTYLFDIANLQEVLDTRRRCALEECMGFYGHWDEHRRFQLAFLKKQGLLPTSTLLEIGRAPLTGGVPIIDYLEPGNYVGIDIRSSAIDLAWVGRGRSFRAERQEPAGLQTKPLGTIASLGFLRPGEERTHEMLKFTK